MATLVLQTAGAVVGNVIGGPIGAIIGQTAGAIAGNAIDQKIFGTGGTGNTTGPRLTSMPAIGASEGTPIPRVYGSVRVGGTLIWMTRFEEQAITTKTGASGGKGGGGGRTTTFKYYANFAVGLCEGPIAGVRRIWADGKEIDQSEIAVRIYQGDNEQNADPLIVAKEGADHAPAYRGLAYVVFERMPLDDFGNRLPLLSFEVIRPVNSLASKVTAVCLIPGSSEYGYDPQFTLQLLQPGVSRSENRHQMIAESDWSGSLDALQAICPNLRSVSLVVAWFGDDLRAGACKIQPRVELASKTTNGAPWQVAGLNRSTAPQVSQYDGKPAFGGSPADETVLRAIQNLKARGLDVVFYPFVMMDIAHENLLSNPWTGAPGQPAYPWRGRITCDPAPDQVGTVDATQIAAEQISSFFGSSAPPLNEWSFRRFILHYANICAQAGGVDAFLIGSEFAALTRVRSAPGVYPACEQLAELAADVAAVLPVGTNISYAADWTEYGAHVLNDGGEVRFPLDVVWGHPDVSFVGIDAYWPLSDWRDGKEHLDAEEHSSIYDLAYLKTGHAGGEGYDWYYASDTDRVAQNRSAITDGAYNEPWVFRQKDIRSWWSNNHHERVDGLQLAQNTNWVAQSKPVWLTEIGCSAVDKGTNAPNVFPDPKSSEDRIPYFSRGNRDDLIQQRAIESYIAHYSPDAEGFQEADNPVSPLFGGRMVDHERLHVWAWDARPFPAFPDYSDVWSDASSWQTGHWLNGRLELASLDNVIRDIVGEIPGTSELDIVTQIGSVTEGYVIERPMSPRSAIEPLAMFFGFDAIISGGQMLFRDRDLASQKHISTENLVDARGEQSIELVRAQESELSRSISMTVYDSSNEYRPVTAQTRRLEGRSQRETHVDLPVVADSHTARWRAENHLRDMWIGRETGQFALPPSEIEVEIGDILKLEVAGTPRYLGVTRLEEMATRSVTVRSVDPVPVGAVARERAASRVSKPDVIGPAEIKVIDLAIMRSSTDPLLYIGAFADPWSGPLAVWRENGPSSFEFVRLITQSARIGVTGSDFGPGPAGRYDYLNTLDVKLSYGALESHDDRLALSGNPGIAVQGADGYWEIINYVNAELKAPGQYCLTGLVRGLGGAEHLAARTVAAGAPVVVLDDAVVPLADDVADLNIPVVYRVGPARRNYADSSYVEITSIASGRALMPYTPVHAKARRVAEGIELSFVRRGRIGADAWETVNIPLGEDVEAYEIEIMSNGSPIRVLGTNSPTAMYASNDETQDFGAQQTTLDLNIYQLSQTVGRGFPLSVSLKVDA